MIERPEPKSARRQHPGGSRIPSALILLTLVGALSVLRPVLWRNQTGRLLSEAAAALAAERYAEAERLAEAVLRRSPESPLALAIAGEAAATRRGHLRALTFLERVPDDGGPLAARALYKRAACLMALGRASEAEDCLQRCLSIAPDHLDANSKMVFLLQMQGRMWESQPHVLHLIRAGRFAADELIMAGSAENLFWEDEQFVDRCLTERPDDPRLSLGRARTLFLGNRLTESESLVRRVLEADPDLLSAHSLLGRILLAKGAADEFLGWHRRLPPEAEAFPEIWLTRGLWAQSHSQPRAAVRCFLEVVARQPHHPAANYSLSQLLKRLGEDERAELFARRSARLSRADIHLSELRGGPNLRLIRELVELLEAMDRYWEAVGWCHLAVRHGTEVDWAEETIERLTRAAVRSSHFTPAEANPALHIDRSRYPRPDWPDPSRRVAEVPVATPAACRVRFVDAAPETGLDFTYFNSMDPEVGLEHIFQTTGGGVAVLDYDQDGWPDLYFANGCPLPPSVELFAREHRGDTDHLFRNLGNGRFQNVTGRAGLGDGRFSQGVTVGDYNNDGFPDVYVANVGGNRFYENNGDGTFREITAQTGTAGDEWTLSALLADVNGDGLPDLYAVNYLDMQEVFHRACKRNGQPLTCAPTLFAAEQDRLYLNLGDGRFEDITERCGIVQPQGKGLGIVAGDFDGSRRLGLFVANDTTANFYFVNQTGRPGGFPRFEEQALLSGLAFNGKGDVQACMGVAAGDANGDLLTDLFVTNFYFDSNTLYLQQSGGTFVEGTREAGLHEPGFEMLGFGTQFLDGELDGFPDLVVANGHVDQTFATGEPDKMPPQYYQNLGGGRFGDVPAGTLGPYFKGRYFGRALARLDWNRDGREDFCTVHLQAPVALLTNRTPQPGNFLAVRLRGTTSSRDAVGATVRVAAGGRTWAGQLTGGDGYQASNQRQLIFGLGTAERAEEIVVHWPSGRVQTLAPQPVGRELLVIEGRPAPLPLSH